MAVKKLTTGKCVTIDIQQGYSFSDLEALRQYYVVCILHIYICLKVVWVILRTPTWHVYMALHFSLYTILFTLVTAARSYVYCMQTELWSRFLWKRCNPTPLICLHTAPYIILMPYLLLLPIIFATVISTSSKMKMFYSCFTGYCTIHAVTV